MKFKRWPRIKAFNDTSRKRAAFHRSMRMRREALPLFSDLIAETQPDVDSEMARRAIAWVDDQQRIRDQRAADWRRARQRMNAVGDNLRPVLILLWREAPYPADPTYLLDFLHSVDVGRINPAAPPWRVDPNLKLKPLPERYQPK